VETNVRSRIYRRAINVGAIIGLVLLASGPVQAATLWSNGAVNTVESGDNRCDSGPNLCGNTGGAFWTIFDNFNIPAASQPWLVTSLDFTDFLVSAPKADIGNTNWSIWSGDPLLGGTLVGSGTVKATLTDIIGPCGTGNICLELFTVNLSTPLFLAKGVTYYLGTTTTVVPTNGAEGTFRAFSAGGNTAPGGTPNGLAHWEQSNGSSTGVPGSSWTAGSLDSTFPSASFKETATAFDINGTLAPVPEPGTMTLIGMGLVVCWLCVRRRTA